MENVLYINIIVENVFDKFYGKVNSTEIVESVLSINEWKIIFHKFYGKLNSTEVSWFLWKNEFHKINGKCTSTNWVKNNFPQILWKTRFHWKVIISVKKIFPFSICRWIQSQMFRIWKCFPWMKRGILSFFSFFVFSLRPVAFRGVAFQKRAFQTRIFCFPLFFASPVQYRAVPYDWKTDVLHTVFQKSKFCPKTRFFENL